jgi:hypothetical protein
MFRTARILGYISNEVAFGSGTLVKISHHALHIGEWACTCNAPNFAVEFFFFSLLAKIRALPFPFLFPFAKP